LGRLTTAQKDAISAGNRVKQTWKILAPLSAGSTTYVPYTIEAGFNSVAASPNNRVTRPGSRKVEVWNPHPQVTARARAGRYSFEVRNDDGKIYPGVGSVWNPYSIYDASPQECLVEHTVLVDLYGDGGSWSSLAYLQYIGRVVDVVYTETSTPGGTPQGDRAVITCEQAHAWDVLRHTFDRGDGVEQLIDIDGAGDNYYWTVT